MKLYIDCKCGCDVLKMESWGEMHTDDDLVWLCIYRSSIGCFTQRLKNAWKYLIHGEYAFNDMTVDKKDIGKMIEFLQRAKTQEGDQ